MAEKQSPTDLSITHYVSTYIDRLSVSQHSSSLSSTPQGICDGQDRETGVSGQADKGWRER